MIDNIQIHNKRDFLKMHNAGKLAAEVLDYITDYVEVGVSTDFLDNLLKYFTGFNPSTIYASFNETTFSFIR